MIIKHALRAASGLLLSLAATFAAAQGYPARPVQLITAFPAGTGTDVAGRLVAEKLAKALGQPFTVINRPGAAGSVAAGTVAAAAADGYTLLFNSSAHTLYPAMYPDLKFDVARDLVPVASVAEVELVLVASTEKGWKSLADMMAYARANPGKLTFGSAGVGTSTHLGFERLASAAHVSALHIPFKGATEAITEVLAGRVDATYTAIGSAQGPIKARQLVPLAFTNRKRSAAMPDVPTSIETLPDSDFTPWVGLLAPAATPRPVVERLNQAVVAILNEPDTIERLTKAGLVPMPQSAAQFAAQINAEFTINAKLMKAATAQQPPAR